ncbi:DUF3613 domain-containing protein [Stenotrophomonas aracearum]|jgi:hypothetical protein|uniref:DUF3613 domain-containing protein n=1 Tax=Stenotrophomonas aracearum TaxID=3003272 RepID=A0ABY9Y8K9_9GAMM|nr:DUF3613 domain-containing protein [Stenotrophomonas sp. A5588]WNH47199.1 DUF3613 domain-containing protein [Stenotrophomonas sp. A5588]
MNVSATARFAGVVLVFVALGTTSALSAESRPAAGVTPAPVVASPTPPDPRAAQIGDATRALLRLQASGERAGTPLPILGDQASASYKRYIDSFTHPIPAYLAPSLRPDAAGGAATTGK